MRLIDWANPKRNDWLAVNQFSIKGPHHTRRPDIILFVNGLPLVLLEFKNPADLTADIWKAFDQIQTYKEQIPDAFQYNELLVVSGEVTRAGWDVRLIFCADKGSAEVHCALEGLANKVLAAEYQTVLPDEKLLADEIQKTQQALGARRLG